MQLRDAIGKSLDMPVLRREIELKHLESVLIEAMKGKGEIEERKEVELDLIKA